MDTSTKNLIKYLILPLALLLIAISFGLYQTRPDWKLHVNSYESGEIFVQTYQGNKILINGGPGDKILSELGRILPFYDHQIDLFILTQADDFHATGLVYVLKRYEVQQVLLPAGEMNSSAMKELLDLINQKQMVIAYLNTNQRIMLDSGTLLDLQARQISFGQTQIKLSGYQTGEIISDGNEVYKKIEQK